MRRIQIRFRRSVLISDTILFLDTCFALFRVLSMTCLFMALVLAHLSLAVSGACGPAFILEDRRGFVTVRAVTDSALAPPLSIIWGCLGLFPGSALHIASHVNLRLPHAFTMLRRFYRHVLRHRRVASCFALVCSWCCPERPRACGAT